MALSWSRCSRSTTPCWRILNASEMADTAVQPFTRSSRPSSIRRSASRGAASANNVCTCSRFDLMASLRKPSASGCFLHSRRLAELVPTASAHCVQFAPPARRTKACWMYGSRSCFLFFTLRRPLGAIEKVKAPRFPTCGDFSLQLLDR